MRGTNSELENEASASGLGDMVLTPSPDTSVAVPDSVVAEAVSGIRAAQTRHGFALSAEIGRVVIEKFYGGDVNQLRQRGPKDASLRKLAQHPDLPMSAASLFNAIGVFELLQRRPDVYSSRHLSPTHVRAILPLPEKDQDRLLKKAEDKALTVDQLTAEAKKVADRAKKHGGGRPRLHPLTKSVSAIRRYFERHSRIVNEIESDGGLTDDQAAEALTAVLALAAQCAEIQARLESRKRAAVVVVEGAGE